MSPIQQNYITVIKILIQSCKTKIQFQNYPDVAAYLEIIQDSYVPHPLRAGEVFEPLEEVFLDLQNTWESDSIIKWLEKQIECKEVTQYGTV